MTASGRVHEGTHPMNKTIKLTIAALVAMMATAMGTAAPAEQVVTAGDHVCC